MLIFAAAAWSWDDPFSCPTVTTPAEAKAAVEEAPDTELGAILAWVGALLDTTQVVDCSGASSFCESAAYSSADGASVTYMHTYGLGTIRSTTSCAGSCCWGTATEASYEAERACASIVDAVACVDRLATCGGDADYGWNRPWASFEGDSWMEVDEHSWAMTGEDRDGDHASDDVDCAPDDPTIRPCREDVALDGIDQDCDGADNIDGDGDGHGDAAYGGDDCDDADPAIRPGAEDTTHDGVDQDCDGDDAVDADADGFASIRDGGGDCDDTDPATNPGALDVYGDEIDQNCDGIDGVDYDSDDPAETTTRPVPHSSSGCATAPGLPAWPLLLAFLVRRRAWRPAAG